MRFSESALFAADLNMQGLCLNCGEARDGVEPDARGYGCHACVCRSVHGASEIAIMGLVSEGAA